MSLCFVTCIYLSRYIPSWWQNNWHLCIQISKEVTFNQFSKLKPVKLFVLLQLINVGTTMNNKLLLSVTHILSIKKILTVLGSLPKDWNYFWNKYLICYFCLLVDPNFPSWCSWSLSLRNKKKKINFHFKGLYKTTFSKSTFPQFFFSHWLLYNCFFSFLIKALVNFEKLVRSYW